MLTVSRLILTLQSYWDAHGCALLQPYDVEVGAGTSHPATFLRAIGPEPWRAAYVQPSRRPKDGRYGENPNRLQHYYQYQVVLKPAPDDIQACYLDSLKALGLDLTQNDVRFVEDDWENPTLGAWGRGWEAGLTGMETPQFPYSSRSADWTARQCSEKSLTASSAWRWRCRMWKRIRSDLDARPRIATAADLRRYLSSK